MRDCYLNWLNSRGRHLFLLPPYSRSFWYIWCGRQFFCYANSSSSIDIYFAYFKFIDQLHVICYCCCYWCKMHFFQIVRLIKCSMRNINAYMKEKIQPRVDISKRKALIAFVYKIMNAMNIFAIYISICGLIKLMVLMRCGTHSLWLHTGFGNESIFSKHYHLHTMNTYLFRSMGDFVVTHQTKEKFNVIIVKKEFSIKTNTVWFLMCQYLANYAMPYPINIVKENFWSILFYERKWR